MPGGQGEMPDPAVPPPWFSAALARTRGWELDPSAAGMKPKKHRACAGCRALLSGSVSAAAAPLPWDKTKSDGDKHRAGGGLIRSLSRGIATCKAALTQMLAPTTLGLRVESTARGDGHLPGAGCCAPVVGLARGHRWETMRIVVFWVRFRKAERNPSFLLSRLSRQDRCK